MKSPLYSFYLCLIFIALSATAEESFKLLFVQILYRHGDRAPIDLYANDPNPVSSWPLGLGSLTLLGRKQHYGLGKFLRSTYKNFMTTNPVEINVTSSDCNRCLESAESNLASFFAPDGEWKFGDMPWQPIPIRYIPKMQDRYLETDSFCPKAEAEKARLRKSPEGQAFIAKHREMFDNLTLYSGDVIYDWTSASYLFDNLWIEKRYNLTVPSWADPWWNELEEVADLSFWWKFNTPLLRRLRAGPLLGRIIERMQDKINGDLEKLKFQVYSAHDTNVAVVLDALNLFNNKLPPYCATLLFELYSGKSDNHFIRMLYLNSTEPEKVTQTPHILILDGCTEFCPLEYFVNYTQFLIPEDWERECEFSRSFVDQMRDQELTVGAVFIIVVVLMLIMTVFAIWRVYTNKRRDRYAYHLMPTS